jgi:hypothetical protein
MGGRENNLSSVLNVPSHCPFVLPVSVKHLTRIIKFNFWRLGTVVACILNLNGNRGNRRLKGYIRADILKLPLGGLHVKHAEQSNVEFGHQLSICSGTKEIHGKP